MQVTKQMVGWAARSMWYDTRVHSDIHLHQVDKAFAMWAPLASSMITKSQLSLWFKAVL